VFVCELIAFLSTNYVTDVVLDPNTDELIRVNFNISVLDLPCDYVSLDVVDVLGTRKEGITQNINKWSIDNHGSIKNYMGRNDDGNALLALDTHHESGENGEGANIGHQALATNGDQFDTYLAGNKYVFANFYAPWCIWCQRLEPVWEALAEAVEASGKPVHVVKIDCVANHQFCIQHRVQAFPTLRFFTGGESHMAQYQSDRTVDSFMRFIEDQLEKDHYVASIQDPEARARAHQERIHEANSAHQQNTGCNLVGFLMLNRVPGNFHILARSENHNMNPAMANLSHVVHSLYFGNSMTARVSRMVSNLPTYLFSSQSNISPMNGNAYSADSLHKAYHHYLKVVSTHFNKGNYKSKSATMVYQMLKSSQVMNYNVDEVPEARFSFDLSPMAVVISKKTMKLYEFVTHIFALVGGTFTVVGLFSGALGTLFKPKRI